MGRWAQRTRRGGSSPIPGARDLQIVSVVVSDGDFGVLITFNRPVTVNANVPNANFYIDNPTRVLADAFQSGPTQMVGNTTSENFAGDVWHLVGRPNWVDELVFSPASGVCTL